MEDIVRVSVAERNTDRAAGETPLEAIPFDRAGPDQYKLQRHLLAQYLRGLDHYGKVIRHLAAAASRKERDGLLRWVQTKPRQGFLARPGGTRHVEQRMADEFDLDSRLLVQRR